MDSTDVQLVSVVPRELSRTFRLHRISHGKSPSMETQQLMTPPHSHAQLLHALFRAIDNRSWLALAQYFDPAVRYERPGYATICGLDDLVLFYQDVRIIGDGEHIIEGIVTDEELGACWGEFRGFTRDRRPIKERYCDAYTFANGRILTRRSHFFRPAV